MQDEVSLIYRGEEPEMLPLCRADWHRRHPLVAARRRQADPALGHPHRRSSGDFFSRIMYDAPRDDEQAIVAAVAALAGRRGVSMAEVGPAWLLHRPGITAPIAGASRLGHVEAALKAVDLALTEAEITELEAPYHPHPTRGY